MSKSIEMRVEELENLVFLSKNVLSFEEASKFLNLSKSYLYKLTSGNLIALQTAGQDALFRESGVGSVATAKSCKDTSADRTGSAEVCS